MRTFLVLACFISLVACIDKPRGPEPVAPPTAPTKDPITGIAPGAADAGPASEPRNDHVRIVEKTPNEEREVKLPGKAQSQLEACHTSGGGKLRVRITREGEKRSLAIEPGSSLDPTERHCVLEALQALRDDEIGGSLGSGATVPATGFTSLLTVEW